MRRGSPSWHYQVRVEGLIPHIASIGTEIKNLPSYFLGSRACSLLALSTQRPKWEGPLELDLKACASLLMWVLLTTEISFHIMFIYFTFEMFQFMATLESSLRCLRKKENAVNKAPNSSFGLYILNRPSSSPLFRTLSMFLAIIRRGGHH